MCFIIRGGWSSVVISLTARRLRGDLIETYKLLHGYTNVDYTVQDLLSKT